MQINERKTNRGFDIVTFKPESCEGICSLQKSSAAEKDYIWLGEDQPKIKSLVYGEGWVEQKLPEDQIIFGRMHLTREEVKALLPYLQRFVETGEVLEREAE